MQVAVQKRKKSRTERKKGGKVHFLHGGCLRLLVLFDSIGGLEKENILSTCPTSVFIQTFHDPLSAQTIGFIA